MKSLFCHEHGPSALANQRPVPAQSGDLIRTGQFGLRRGWTGSDCVSQWRLAGLDTSGIKLGGLEWTGITLVTCEKHVMALIRISGFRSKTARPRDWPLLSQTKEFRLHSTKSDIRTFTKPPSTCSGVNLARYILPQPPKIQSLPLFAEVFFAHAAEHGIRNLRKNSLTTRFEYECERKAPLASSQKGDEYKQHPRNLEVCRQL